MKIKAIITYQNGEPNFDEEGWQIINDNKVGFTAIGNIDHNPPTGTIEAYVYAPESVVNLIKAGEWAIEYENGIAINQGVDWLEDIIDAAEV